MIVTSGISFCETCTPETHIARLLAFPSGVKKYCVPVPLTKSLFARILPSGPHQVQRPCGSPSAYGC